MVGADKWCNPDDDLPQDFHFQARAGQRMTGSRASRWTLRCSSTSADRRRPNCPC